MILNILNFESTQQFALNFALLELPTNFSINEKLFRLMQEGLFYFISITCFTSEMDSKWEIIHRILAEVHQDGGGLQVREGGEH